MADNDATRELFRELLGMTSGGTAGGREAMSIPADIMDSLAGDAAQESLARDRLIMEMRKRDTRQHDPRYVSLDLMEMEAHDVDKFLSTARKKIIKRSKPTRKSCCTKIGGVLDQMMGPMGGEHADQQGMRDRGADDPTGDVDQMAEGNLDEGVAKWRRRVYSDKTQGGDLRQAKTRLAAADASSEAREKSGKHQYGRSWNEIENSRESLAAKRARQAAHDAKRGQKPQVSSIEIDLARFVAEEFAHWEHGDDCQFADPRAHRRALGESFGAGSPGLVRDALAEASCGGSMMKLKKRLKEKKLAEGLTGKDAIVYKRLSMVSLDQGGDYQEEDTNMEPSKTAMALSAFMESSHSGGKGAPDPGMMKRGDEAGDMSRKQRPDNAEYPTELMPAKSGGNKTAGDPKPAKGAAGGHTPRWEKGADPIGEDEFEGRPRISETAMALANFMEANGQYETAKKRLAMRKGDAGELSTDDREKQPYGLPLKPAKGERDNEDGGPRYQKGADPRGGTDEGKASGSRMRK